MQLMLPINVSIIAHVTVKYSLPAKEITFKIPGSGIWIKTHQISSLKINLNQFPINFRDFDKNTHGNRGDTS